MFNYMNEDELRAFHVSSALKETPEITPIIEAIQHLGDFTHESGDLDGTKVLFEVLHDFLDSVGADREKISANIRLALLKAEKGYTDEARALVGDIVAIAKGNNWPDIQGQAYLVLAKITSDSGNEERAAKCFRKAMKLISQSHG
jgi:hypothetical protein